MSYQIITVAQHGEDHERYAASATTISAENELEARKEARRRVRKIEKTWEILYAVLVTERNGRLEDVCRLI